MCLQIVAVALSVIGSLATAVMTSQMAKAQAQIEQQQLRVEMENERIAALGATNNRLEEFRKAEATNRAMLSNMGVENISYAMGIVPYNKGVVGRDIAGIEFNAGQVVGRKKYEIAVSGWKAKAESRMAMIGAVADSFGTIGNYVAGGRGGSGNSISS